MHRVASPIIIIFDGVCSLCNHTVDFLIRHDRDRRFRYASFQSDEGAAALRVFGIDAVPITVYVIDNGRVYRESDGILHLLTFLPAPWPWLRALRVIPRPIRDGVYRLIARNRYRWFGKRDTCRVPTEEERKMFL